MSTTFFNPLPNLDAFSRLRVSNPNIMVSTTNIHCDTPQLWQNVLTGSATATHMSNLAVTRLAVSALSDLAIRQTRFYIPYQPGRSLLLLSTFCVSSLVTGQRIRVGYFDANDGIFLECIGSSISLVRRTSTSGSPVDNTISQSSWNVDTLDGNGPSGLTLDLTKSQILVIDLQWLGVGAVRVGFDIDGDIVWVHEFRNANIRQNVYMASGTLPYRLELENTTATSSASMDQICFGAILEGGAIDTFSRYAAADTGLTKTTVAEDNEEPLLAYRLKQSHNRAIIVPGDYHAIAADGTKAFYARLYSAPPGSVTGTWVSASNASEYCLPSSVNLNNARLISDGMGSKEGRSGVIRFSALGSVGRDLDGSVDEVILTVVPLTKDSDFYATVNWQEIY